MGPLPQPRCCLFGWPLRAPQPVRRGSRAARPPFLASPACTCTAPRPIRGSLGGEGGGRCYLCRETCSMLLLLLLQPSGSERDREKEGTTLGRSVVGIGR